MNTFSDILTRIPFLSIRFVVRFPPHETIRQLQNAIALQYPINSEVQDFFYNADFEGQTFLIQTAHIKRYKNKELIPDRKISYLRAYDPLSMDQTPIFHGMVLRHGYGDESIIKGHFGIGTPVYLTLIAVLVIVSAYFLNLNSPCLFPLAALFVFRALLSIFQFASERKRIRDFLHNIFDEVIYENRDD